VYSSDTVLRVTSKSSMIESKNTDTPSVCPGTVIIVVTNATSNTT
jgi:hypothetical protein